MKIAMSFLRIDLESGPVHRLAIHRHYESGHGNAGCDPRALAAAAFGTIAQQVTVLLQWSPFDFGIKGGLVIDPENLFEAMDIAGDDPEMEHILYFAKVIGAMGEITAITSDVVKAMPIVSDPIPDDKHGQNRR